MTRTLPRTYTFTVAGQGLFPFDMLRYDRCTPKTERDSHEIERTTRFSRELGIRRHASHHDPYRVALVGPRPPTEGRWASFGWAVESVE